MWQGGSLRGDGFQCAASTASTDAGIYGFAGLAADILVNALPVDHAGSANEVTLDFPRPHEFIHGAAADAGVGDGGGDLKEGRHNGLAGSACGVGLSEGGLFFGVQHVLRICPLGGGSFPNVESGLFGARMIKSTDRVPADEAGPASIFSRLPLLLVISAAAGPQKIGFSSTRGLALALFPAPGSANRVMCNTIPDGHLWKGLQILFFQKHRFFWQPVALSGPGSWPARSCCPPGGHLRPGRVLPLICCPFMS